MKYLLFALLLFVGITTTSAQIIYLSGNLVIDTLPTRVGVTNKFIVKGTFKDPRGLFFPSDVAVGMTFWRQGYKYVIDSILQNSTNPITIRVLDYNNVGFVAAGVASIMDKTPKGILLPPASGDNHPEYTLPPDYSGIMGEIITKIDSLLPNSPSYAEIGWGAGISTFTVGEASTADIIDSTFISNNESLSGFTHATKGVIVNNTGDTIVGRATITIGVVNTCDDPIDLTVRLRKNTTTLRQISINAGAAATSPRGHCTVQALVTLLPGDSLRGRISTGIGTNCEGLGITDYSLIFTEIKRL